MHGPNGANYANLSQFVEILQDERIVFDHISPPKFRIVALFEAAGADTQLVFRMIFNSVAERDKIATIAVPANEENFDRLEVELRRA